MSLRDTTWIERAKKTAEFHKAKVKENPNWTINQTADALRRAKGAISEDLTLVSWLDSHPDIAKFQYLKDAIEFCRKKKHVMRIR